MNAYKNTNQQALLYAMHSFLSPPPPPPDTQFLSPHTSSKKGEMMSLLIASHTLAVKRCTV